MVTSTQTSTSSTSLSVPGKRFLSPLHNLPLEIIIHIIECAMLNNCPSNLALISRVMRYFVSIVLYSTVALDASHMIILFHRTAVSPQSSSLLTHVKRLVIAWRPKCPTSSGTEQRLQQIISRCSGLRSLTVTSLRLINISPLVTTFHDGPSDLTLRSFEDISDSLSPDPKSHPFHTYFSASLTHLRICEPGDTWQSPSCIIAAFNGAPNLTHLQLARRADSNTNNDVIFADEIAQLLSRRKNLKKVVVTIFGSALRPTLNSLRESNIWMVVSKLEEFDSRVVVVKGELGKGWKDTRGSRCGEGPVDFWEMV